MRTDDDIRRMLQRRARDVRPSLDAWERITERLEAPAKVRPFPGRWVVPALSAAAVLALVVAGLAVLDDGDDDRPVTAGRPSTTTTEPEPTATTAAPAPDDPLAVADTYLEQRLSVPVEVLEFQQGDAQSGEVPYRFGDGAGGTLLLRHGDGGWGVVAAIATDLPIEAATYDGDRVRVRAVPAVTGEVELTVRRADGQGATSTESVDATAGESLSVMHTFFGAGRIVIELRLFGPDGLVAYAEAHVERMRVDLAGIGDVAIGMTVDEAAAALGTELLSSGSGEPDPTCSYVRPAEGWAFLRFMAVDGAVARIEVTLGPVTTTQGVGIGSTEDEVLAAYPGAEVADTNFPQGGHNITFLEGERGFVFQTFDETVITYSAGRLPELLYLDGCP